ncbi:MAG: alpha/beta fold hydrolase [Burkholderiales bacterium]
MRRVACIGGLELISHVPAKPSHPAQLLFVHGAFVAAWCWDEHFLPYFAQQGYAAHAVSLRGHGGSAGRDTLVATSIDDYENDVQRIARHLGSPLVIIGHSMGGMVVQRCLHKLPATAAVLMASVPPEGLLGSSMLLAARDPELFSEVNLLQHAHPSQTTLRAVRRTIFSAHIPDEEIGRHLSRMQQESERAVFDLSWPQQFFIGRAKGVPVLVLGGAEDAFFNTAMIESTARVYGVKAEIFPDMAHAMMLEPAWQRAADRIIDWLAGVGA